jgi:arylsulfatase A
MRSPLFILAFLYAAQGQSSTPSFLFMLGDDIGWSDFRFNNGTALTPRITEWISRKGTLLLQDFHTGGTVCSPTRATILTGRNHFRDCVNYVYDCSDPTQCTPDFEFAPQRTFTIADAVRAAGQGYVSHFGGKWCVARLCSARALAPPSATHPSLPSSVFLYSPAPPQRTHA